MNNRMLLAQARKGIAAHIAESPETITITRTPLIDNGFGGKIEDPLGVPIPHDVLCRISHERARPDAFQSLPAGLDTAFYKFIATDFEQDIATNDIFFAQGRQWKIGPVDKLVKFGDIIGFEAILIPADTIGAPAEPGT